MKTFVASLCVFALLIGGICLNCVFINRVTAEFDARLTAMPPCPDAPDAVSSLAAFWRERKTAISVSLPSREVERMDELLTELETAARCGEAADFERAKALIGDLAAQIRDHERFSLDNIL